MKKRLIAMIAGAAIASTSSITHARADWYHHGGYGIGPGAAIGLGLGSFALGAALANPYGPRYGYYPYYGYPGPAYYVPPPVIAPRSCFNPYSGGYYPC